MKRTLMNTSLGILMLASALALGACAAPHDQWTGTETLKRNAVEFVHLTHDAELNESGGDLMLSDAEASKLTGFLNQVRLAYGDEISVDGGDGPNAPRRAAAAAEYLAKLGLRVSSTETIYGAPLEGSSVRIVIGRHIVSPPECPNWSKLPSPDYQNAESSNLGCANATNIGLMVANPGDLLGGRGQATGDAEVAAKAVEKYRLGTVKKPESSQTAGEADNQ